MSLKSKIKFLAYYLPQYHAIPENDEWWGKGFTEWTNVKKAKPLFKGHQQPVIPGELGYYDLLKTEGIQEKQAKLAKDHGIDGFIYYQYWFGNGKMLLEKPAEKMLKNKSIDMPFCFCWANETWSGVWHGSPNKILMEQKYFGESDYINYFNYLLPFFLDERYIKIDNKPMFHIYKLHDIPDLPLFLETFKKLALKNGFDGMHFIATGGYDSPEVLQNTDIEGVVAIDLFRKLRYAQNVSIFQEDSSFHKWEKIVRYYLGISSEVGIRKKPLMLNYKKGIKKLSIEIPNHKFIPCIIPNWDNSPRSGHKSLILSNATPEVFEKYFQKIVDQLQKDKDNQDFVVIKSWNEWAEGNHLEPDKKYGNGWLQVVKNIKNQIAKS